MIGGLMPLYDSSIEAGRSLLGTVFAPLRLPWRLVGALDLVEDALQDVRPMRSEVATIRKQSEPLAELLSALDSLKGDLVARLDGLYKLTATLEEVETDLDENVAQVIGKLTVLHETVLALQDDVQRITNRLPDPDAPGPLERAREALTGSGAE
jgi:hypothetical protein